MNYVCSQNPVPRWLVLAALRGIAEKGGESSSCFGYLVTVLPTSKPSADNGRSKYSAVKPGGPHDNLLERRRRFRHSKETCNFLAIALSLGSAAKAAVAKMWHEAPSEHYFLGSKSLDTITRGEVNVVGSGELKAIAVDIYLTTARQL